MARARKKSEEEILEPEVEVVEEEVLFDAFPKQVEFLELVFAPDPEVIMYGGAIRGGKTYGGLGALILLCLQWPGSRWAVVRKDLPTLKRNTVPSFKKIVPTQILQGQSIDKAYNESKQTVSFLNGSQLLFFPENYTQDKELNRWKGLEVNGFLLEEANENQEESFYKAIERAGTWLIPGIPKEEQPPPKILMTCNPAQNWVKRLLYTPWKLGKLPKNWHYIQSRIFDNPHIPKKYIESLKRLPKNQYQVFVLGNWDIKLKTGAEFYHSFDIDLNVKPTKYDPELPLHISFDENVNPYLPASIWQGSNGQLRQIDEIALSKPRNKIKYVCYEIARRYKFHTAGVFIYGDATSKKDDTKIEDGQNFFKLAAKYLGKFKPRIRVPKSNPSVVMRANFINAIFAGDIQGLEIVIGDNCELSIADLSNILEDSNGKKLKIKVKDPKTGITFEEFGHFSDTMDYIVTRFFASEYRTYQKGPVDSIPRTIKKKRVIKGY